jgi:uncharacterized protein (TIGR00251 family)
MCLPENLRVFVSSSSKPPAPVRTLLRLKIVPNARRSEVVGEHGDALKIKIQAPAMDGKANAALLEFLAEALQIPTRTLELTAGEKSRDKTVAISGLELAEIRARLLGEAERGKVTIDKN